MKSIKETFENLSAGGSGCETLGFVLSPSYAEEESCCTVIKYIMVACCNETNTLHCLALKSMFFFPHLLRAS